jgi:hypothetical protein
MRNCGFRSVLPQIGNTYTGYGSANGEDWTAHGEPHRDLTEARLGLTAAQAAEGIPAQFDHFVMTSLQG